MCRAHLYWSVNAFIRNPLVDGCLHARASSQPFHGMKCVPMCQRVIARARVCVFTRLHLHVVPVPRSTCSHALNTYSCLFSPSVVLHIVGIPRAPSTPPAPLNPLIRDQKYRQIPSARTCYWCERANTWLQILHKREGTRAATSLIR